MAAVPFALSVHNFISSVGADAGFASVIGLAILALLYFAHARETASLREEAAGLAQRLQEAEARLADARAQAVVAEALPAPETNPAGPGLGGARATPAAPAGMAAPALAAATRFIPAIPAGSPVVRRLSPPVSAPAPAPATTPAPAPAPLAAPAPAPVMAPAAAATVQARAPAAARATSASDPETSTPAPATVAGGANGVASPPRPSVPEAAPLLASAPPRFIPPARNTFVAPPPDKRSSPGGRRFLMLVGVLVLIGAAAAVVIITSGTGNPAPAPKPRASNAPGPAPATFDASHVTVAVLNGTATNQLAHHIAAHLSVLGYKKGVIATASNQSVNSTVVAYLPGSSNRIDANHVAKALHLKRRAVQPINQAAQAVACPPPAACGANVVVTVGTDLSGA
jgi:LytR cell envelope-related transcriptional attenuator